MDPETQREAEALYLQQLLCAVNRNAVYRESWEIHGCFKFQQTATFRLLLLARNLLIDGETTYIDEVMELEKIWDHRPQDLGAPFPVSLSDEERKTIAADMQVIARGIHMMRGIRESHGQLFPDQGFVPNEK